MTVVKNPAARATKAYPADDRWLFWTGEIYRPFTDKAEVLAAIPTARRHIGLQALIGSEWYTFKSDITDDDLQPLLGLKQIAFIVGSGEPGVPADGDDTYTNSDMIGMKIWQYNVWSNGIILFPNAEYTNNIIAGGFTLIAGSTFSLDQRVIIR